LKVLPAKLGSDIELRCTKILEQQSGDVIMTSGCDPGMCGHLWTKNGTVLNATTTDSNKFEFSNETTYGYCATFGDTTNAFNKFRFSNDSYGFKCMVTSMKIKQITVEDLGVYVCNFSNHYNTKEDYYGWATDPTIDETEVVELGTKDQSKEVTYFTQTYQHSNKQMLVQCVATGGKLNWFVKPKQKSPKNQYANECGYSECPEEYISIEKLKTLDHWICYNFSVETLNPFPNVTESLVGFTNLCRSDYDLLICTVDDQVKFEYSWEKKVTITENTDYGYYPYYYNGNEAALYLSIICIPILLGLSLIAMSILAFIRGNVCDCCSGRSRFSTLAIVPQPTMQVQRQQILVPAHGHAQPRQIFIQPHSSQHQIQPHLQPQQMIFQPQAPQHLVQPQQLIMQPQQLIMPPQQVFVQQALPLQVQPEPVPEHEPETQRVPIPGPQLQARTQGHSQPDIETFENDELGRSLI